MKHKNKLHILFLILALAVFTGQELLHPVFHAHRETDLPCFEHQSSKTEEFKETGKYTKDNSFKLICPICNSIANKSTHTTAVQSKLIDYNSLTYSQTRESFSFNTHIKPVSRGPPVA